MVCCLLCWRNLMRSLTISMEGEACVDRGVNKEKMPKDIPRIWKWFRFSFLNADRANLSEGTELGAAAWPSLEPHNKRNSLFFSHDIPSSSSEEIVEHSTLAFGVIPIQLLVAYHYKNSYPRRTGSGCRLCWGLSPKRLWYFGSSLWGTHKQGWQWQVK